MIGWGISWAPVAIGYKDQLLEMMIHISSGIVIIPLEVVRVIAGIRILPVLVVKKSKLKVCL